MRKTCFVGLLLCAVSGSLNGQAVSPSPAKSYVLHAAEAMGGLDLLRGVKALRIEYRGHSYMLDESERPAGPWIVTYENDVELRDYEHASVRREKEHWQVGGSEADKSTLTVAEGFAQVANGAKLSPTSIYLGEPDDSLESLAFAPEQIVQHALEAGDLAVQPDAIMQGEPYHVVSFTYHTMPTRLYLSAYTGLPGSVEWTSSYPHSMFWRVWGDVSNRSVFSLYTLLPSGLRLPLQRDHESNNQPYHSLTILKIAVNPQIPPDAFAIATEVKAAVQEGRDQNVKTQALGNPVPLIEGNDSMVQFAGAFKCAIVQQSDGLVIIEAPVSSEHTKTLFAEAAKRYPNVPIKAVITTSDAWAHFAGIREVVADGTPIYATDLNQPVLTRLVDAPFTQHPDTLAKASKPAKFHWVSQKTTIGAGPNRIEIYPIRNASGARMLMLYLPEFHLLYSSDLVQPLGDGSFFWPEYLRELSDAVQREHLSVDRFFGMHATVTPWTAIVQYLAKVTDASDLQSN
jgi:hypothetical protein